MASQRDVLKMLLSFLPPGSERWLALDPDQGDAIGKVFLALAAAFKTYGTDVLDTLRRELDWYQLDARLPDWESVLALATSLTARYGSLTARRAQVSARRREVGAPTVANIQNALAAIAGYAPTLLEPDRAAIRAANTYAIGGGVIPVGGTLQLTATATDNAVASAMGAQVTFRLTHTHPGNLTFTLQGPDATTKTWAAATKPVGEAAVVAVDFRLAAKEFAGKDIAGTWIFSITDSGLGAGSVVSVGTNGLFVEGIGRNGAGADGLGAAMYEWAAQIDPALVDAATYNLQTIAALVRRWNPAQDRGFAVTKNSLGGGAAIFDDPNTPLDGGTFE